MTAPLLKTVVVSNLSGWAGGGVEMRIIDWLVHRCVGGGRLVNTWGDVHPVVGTWEKFTSVFRCTSCTVLGTS